MYKLHDNNFRPVVWLWRPFHRHFVHFRRRWDSTASIINALTTFLLLSFSKLLFISFTLLYNFSVQVNDDNPSKYVLYYDPTVDCHALEYTMFAAIAVCVLIIFIIFPTFLLILYPTRLFRKCVLPDRLINPEEYEPQLPTTDAHTAAEHTRNKEPDNEYARRLTPVYTYGSIS